jgi:hypothetical protein
LVWNISVVEDIIVKQRAYSKNNFKINKNFDASSMYFQKRKSYNPLKTLSFKYALALAYLDILK